MSLLTPFLLAFALATTAPAAEDQLLADSFARMVADGTWTPLAEAPVLAEWRGIRPVFERYSCVDVRSWQVIASSPEMITMTIDATGTVVNAARSREPYPRVWYLVRGKTPGTIANAMTEPIRLIKRMMAVPDEEAAPLARGVAPAILREAAYTLVVDTRSGGCGFHRTACGRVAQLLFEEAERRSLVDVAAFAELAISSTERGTPGADAALRTAMELAERSGDIDVVALAYAVTFRNGSDRVATEPSFAIAMAAFDVLDDPRVLLLMARERALRRFTQFGIPEAFRAYDEMYQYADRMDWKRGRMLATHGKALCVASSTDYETTRRYCMEVAEDARELGDGDWEARALNIYGQTLAEEMRHREAVPIYERALAVAPPYAEEMIAVFHANLAYAYFELGRLDRATFHAETAMTSRHISTSAYRSPTMLVAAKVRAAHGRHRDAIALAREGMDADESRLWSAWEHKEYVGTLLAECGDVDAAIDEFLGSIDLLEARRVVSPSSTFQRAAQFGEQIGVYRKLAEALVRQQRYEEALVISEKMRARVLSDMLLVPDGPPLEPADQQRQKALNERVVTLNRALLKNDTAATRGALHTARAELEELATAIALRYQRTSAPVPATAAVFDRQLPANTVAVTYVVNETATLAFRIGRDGVTAVVIPAGAKELTRQVEAMVAAVDARSFAYRSSARALHDLLLAPLGLEPADALCIIPEGPLWRLPFHALIGKDNRALIESRRVFYAPSLSTAVSHGAPRVAKTAGVFGNPAGSQTPLAHSETEARRVAAIYGGSGTAVFVGGDALESVFKQEAPRFAVLHLAAHARVDDLAPMYSAVMLAGNEKDDGLLEAREVLETRLNADVAVLAGCETAAGKVHQGEGVIGLAWAFMAAGCPTTIVSQWKADSAATEKLMVEFHRHLAAGATPAAALQKAQVKLMKEARYADPFYWAAFVVMGAGG